MDGICEYCHKRFKKKNKASRFCSRPCYGKWATGRDSHNNPIEIPGGSRYRQCKTCGETFKPRTIQDMKEGHGKYCSRECYFKARRAGLVVVRNRGINKTSTTRNTWYYAHGWQYFRKALIKNKSCEMCGATTHLHAHHKTDPFPNKDVVLLFNTNNIMIVCLQCHRKLHRTNTTYHKCEACGKDFRERTSGKNKYCSSECYQSTRRVAQAICPVCNTEFTPARPRIKACSKKCAAILGWQRKIKKR